MRTAGWILTLPMLATCSAGFDATCKQIYTTVCSHQLECNLVSDHAACDADMQDQWICNPDASVAELKTCKELAPEAGCNQAMPEECYKVLCDKQIGCIQTSVNPDSNPENEPTAETGTTP